MKYLEINELDKKTRHNGQKKDESCFIRRTMLYIEAKHCRDCARA